MHKYIYIYIYEKYSALKDGYLKYEKRECFGCNLKDSREW